MEQNSSYFSKIRETLDTCVFTVNSLEQQNNLTVIKVIEAVNNYLNMVHIEFEIWNDNIFDIKQFTYNHMSYNDENINKDLGFPPDVGWRIGWTKIDSRYKLAAKRILIYDEQIEERDFGVPIPLIEAPYVVRIGAIECLEHLIDDITNKAKDYLKMIKNISVS